MSLIVTRLALCRAFLSSFMWQAALRIKVPAFAKLFRWARFFSRRPARNAASAVPSARWQIGPEAEKAKALWRGAMVQMKAFNTATAWPIHGRREMRSDAEARLDRYFAHLERMLGRDLSREKPSGRMTTLPD